MSYWRPRGDQCKTRAKQCSERGGDDQHLAGLHGQQLSQKDQESIGGNGHLRVAHVAPAEHLLKLVDGYHHPGILFVALLPQLPQVTVQGLNRGCVFVGGQKI